MGTQYVLHTHHITYKEAPTDIHLDTHRGLTFVKSLAVSCHFLWIWNLFRLGFSASVQNVLYICHDSLNTLDLLHSWMHFYHSWQMDIQIAAWLLKIQATSYHSGQTLASVGLVSTEQRLNLTALLIKNTADALIANKSCYTISTISCLLLYVCQCLQV